jgi:ADP-heptose:LPS heptosyltransferase
MKRFRGQELPEAPKVAVIANDALGNFVVATPLLQMVRAQVQPESVTYFGGRRTQELEEASDLIDRAIPLHGSPVPETIATLTDLASSFDLVINLEDSPLAKVAAATLVKSDGYWSGPAVGPTGRPLPELVEAEEDRLLLDSHWTSPDLLARYPVLKSPFIAEIFCRVSYLEGPVPRYRVARKEPVRAIPDILIATAASSADKLWPQASWIEALVWLKGQGLSVGLLGARPSDQRAFWKGDGVEDTLVTRGLVDDLRGTFTLPEVVGALAEARLVLTLDNGILHLAASTNTPTIGLFRHGIHRLWAPPIPTLTVLEPGPDRAVSDMAPTSVIEALERGLLEGRPVEVAVP